MHSRKVGSTLVGLKTRIETHNPDSLAGRSALMRAAVSEHYRLSRQRQREMATPRQVK